MTDKECLEQILSSLKSSIKNNNTQYCVSREETYNDTTYIIGRGFPRVVFQFDSKGTFLRYHIRGQ